MIDLRLTPIMVSTHFVYCHDRFENNPNYVFFSEIVHCPDDDSANIHQPLCWWDPRRQIRTVLLCYLILPARVERWMPDHLAPGLLCNVRDVHCTYGREDFFLVAPTQSNIELFNQYTSQETDAQLVDPILIANNSPNVAEFHCIQNVLVSGIN